MYTTFVLYVYDAASDLDVCKIKQLELLNGCSILDTSAPFLGQEVYCNLAIGIYDLTVIFRPGSSAVASAK